MSEQPRDEKASKVDADYVERSIFPDEACRLCTMFRRVGAKRRGACTAVSGSISPNGWCRFYETKEA